jgi:hypothetical protein
MGIYMKGDGRGGHYYIGKGSEIPWESAESQSEFEVETEFPLCAVEAERNFHNITPPSGRDRVAQVGATS